MSLSYAPRCTVIATRPPGSSRRRQLSRLGVLDRRQDADRRRRGNPDLDVDDFRPELVVAAVGRSGGLDADVGQSMGDVRKVLVEQRGKVELFHRLADPNRGGRLRGQLPDLSLIIGCRASCWVARPGRLGASDHHRPNGAALSDAQAGTPDDQDRHAVDRGRTVHGEAANAGHRVLAPDDAEVEAYLEQALHAPPPQRVETEAPEQPDTVAVLDFGSQFAQLIARRVRELNVYSELLPHDTPMAELERRGVRAVILSGGPASVYDADAPRADPALWSGRIPVLGICYGMQLMAHELGGEVVPSAKREYGPATVSVTDGDGAVRRPRARAAGVDEPRRLDHPAAGGLPRRPRRPIPRRTPALADPAATCTASSSTPRSSTRPIGRDVLRNFVLGHRRRRAELDRREPRRDDRGRDPRARSATASVICALSGGVDSAVAATLVHRAIGDQLTCIYVDHGLMRKRESELLRVDLRARPGHAAW